MKKKLSDYEIIHGSTLSGAVRLLGGAQAPEEAEGNARQFDASKATKFGVIGTKKECTVYSSGNSCKSDGVQRAQFPCHPTHVLCPGCAFLQLEGTVKMNGKTTVDCPFTCDKSLNIDALFVVAGLTSNEITEFEVQLGKNAYRDSICPNSACESFVYADSIVYNRVQCPKCKNNNTWYCKKCKQSWKSGDSEQYICGNATCSSAAEVVEMLNNCGPTTISLGDEVLEKVPKLRLCPACKAFNEHSGGCKRMTCKACKKQYCHSCLKFWDQGCGYSTKCAPPAPVQTI